MAAPATASGSTVIDEPVLALEYSCAASGSAVAASPAPAPAAVGGAAAAAGAPHLAVGDTLALDQLGPVILNSDGTLSRITNWHALSPAEQATTFRMIAKRNAARKAVLDAAEVSAVAERSDPVPPLASAPGAQNDP